MSLSLLFLIGYFILLLSVAKLFSHKIANLSDFFQAGRKLGSWPIAFTFAASWFGAGSTMGSMNAIHDNGISGLWAVIIPSLISCVFITQFLAKRVAQQNCMTQPEAVETHFGKTGRVLLGIIILISSTGFIAAQMVAGGAVFKSVFNINLLTATLFSTSVVVAYSMLGGYFAVVVTDIVQMILVSAGLLLLMTATVVGAFQADPHAIQTLLTTQPDSFWHLSTNWGSNLALTLTFVLAWVIAPEMWQRMTSTTDGKVAYRSGWQAITVLCILFVVVLITSVFSPLVLGKSDAVLVDLAYTLPSPMMTYFVLIGFIAAVTSSIDSTINVGSLTLTRDFYQRFINPKATTNQLLWCSRISTILIVIPAMTIALGIQNIIEVLWISADVYASAMFVPMIALLYLKHPAKLGGNMAMGFGLAVVIFSKLIHYHIITAPVFAQWPQAPYSTLLGVGTSVIAFLIGTAIEAQQSKTVLTK